MSYIGQGLPADVFSGFVTDSFTGDGSATTFTLSKVPFSEDTLIVVINNVIQKPTTNFTVSGTTLTIVGTAVADGDVIYAIHTGGAIPITTPGDNSVTSAKLSGNLVTPGTLDVNGNELILDSDADTSITADTDDKIEFKCGGLDTVNINKFGQVVHTRDSATTFGGSTSFIHQRGTIASPSVVNSGDTLGMIQTTAYDGTAYLDGARILFQVDGTPGDDDMPTRIVFQTTADGTAGSLSESMRIINSGRLLIGHSSVDLASVVSVRSSTDDSLITADNAKSDVSGYVIRSAADRGATVFYAFYDALSGNAADREFYVRGDGNVYADGSFSGSGADYAEFFESKTGNAIAVGTTVVLEDNKVRASTDSDEASSIIGVVRPKSDTMIKASMVIGNCAWNHWSGKYLTDDYDSFITEEFTITEWTETTYEDGNSKTEEVWYETDKIPSDVIVPTEDVKDSDGRVIKTKAVVKTTEADGVNKLIRKKENPSFDKNKEYSPREKRDEWVIVGLLGQVPINKGQKTGDRWIKMRDKSDTVEEWYIR